LPFGMLAHRYSGCTGIGAGRLGGKRGARPRSKHSLRWASPCLAVAADDVAVAGGCAIAKHWRTILTCD
jgi:hypothetical protein